MFDADEVELDVVDDALDELLQWHSGTEVYVPQDDVDDELNDEHLEVEILEELYAVIEVEVEVEPEPLDEDDDTEIDEEDEIDYVDMVEVEVDEFAEMVEMVETVDVDELEVVDTDELEATIQIRVGHLETDKIDKLVELEVVEVDIILELQEHMLDEVENLE